MEIPIRIRLWKNMISDYLAERRIDLAFSSQVRSRVILELLFLENPSEDIHHDEQLIILDDSLKSLSLNGNFIWDPILEGSFPRNIFWFLYLKIISESL